MGSVYHDYPYYYYEDAFWTMRTFEDLQYQEPGFDHYGDYGDFHDFESI